MMNLDHDTCGENALVEEAARQPWRAPAIEVIEARTAESGFVAGPDAFTSS